MRVFSGLVGLGGFIRPGTENGIRHRFILSFKFRALIAILAFHPWHDVKLCCESVPEAQTVGAASESLFRVLQLPSFHESVPGDCPSSFGTLPECSGDSPEANPHPLGDLPQREPLVGKLYYLLAVEDLPRTMGRQVLAGSAVHGPSDPTGLVILPVSCLASLNALKDQTALELSGCPEDL